VLQVVPKFVVCASLRDVINSAFPLAMEARRVSSLQASTATPPAPAVVTTTTAATPTPPFFSAGEAVHCGVGCDLCGLYPITGKRFRCKECPDQWGFDLCSACNAEPFTEPMRGRFGQHHTSDHQVSAFRKRNRK
jgi:hypothetical protein